jgi:hypothetical protein
VVERRRVWAGKWRRPWLVANRANLPQKWPPPPGMDWNVASLCELSRMTEPMELFTFRGRADTAPGCQIGEESGATSNSISRTLPLWVGGSSSLAHSFC